MRTENEQQQSSNNKRRKTADTNIDNNNMGAKENYYDILGVDRNATAEGTFILLHIC